LLTHLEQQQQRQQQHQLQLNVVDFTGIFFDSLCTAKVKNIAVAIRPDGHVASIWREAGEGGGEIISKQAFCQEVLERLSLL